MKKTLLFLFFIIVQQITAATNPLSSRDTIFLKNGEIYKVRIIAIKNDTVFYRLYSDEQQKFFNVSDVKSLNYDNGRVVIPSLDKQKNEDRISSAVPFIEPNSEAMFWKGNDDARKFYKNKSIIAAGVFLGIFLYLGAFFTGIIALSKPNLNNIFKYDKRFKGLANTRSDPLEMRKITYLFKNPDYVKGYRKSARRRKAGKLWLGFAFGAALIISILFISLYGN